MVKEVRIYVEGGGDRKEDKALLRAGFAQFFQNALGKNIKVIPCGGRDQALDNFIIARTYANSITATETTENTEGAAS